MSNADRFLQAFNRIEEGMRRLVNNRPGDSFNYLLGQAKQVEPTLRRYARTLQEFSELRNAIVHDTIDSYVIAEPNHRAVTEIERIDQLVNAPPTVWPQFKRDVLHCDGADQLATVIAMLYQKDISQMPVFAGKQFRCLLTAGMVTRWLGANATAPLNLKSIRVSDLIDYSEPHQDWEFVGRTTTLITIVDLFEDAQHRGHPLQAVLITANGSPKEALQGIITIWDLPEIYAAIG